MSDLDFDYSSQPNDAFFKQVFSRPEYAAAFFQGHLPPSIAASVDWQSLVVLPTTFVKSDLRQTHADLLFSATIGRRKLLLYLLFEHQTKALQNMPLRMLGYVSQILLQHERQHGLPLPVVLPFVLNQGPERWTVSCDFADLFDLPEEAAPALLPFIPKFHHALLDLTQFNPEREEDQREMKVVLNLMKLARNNDLMRFFEWLGQAGTEATVVLYRDLFRMCFVYAAHVDASLDMRAVTQQLIADPELQTQAMTLAQQLRQEGRQEGIQKGEWIGKLQLLQQLAGEDVTPGYTLQPLGLDELERAFRELEGRYHTKFKR